MKTQKHNIKLKIFFLTIIFCAVFGVAVNSQAAEHYIRSDASGANNGNDWANAWDELPANLTRGDTYYVADGNYGAYTFDDAVDGEQYITVKKATIGEHGTEIGWQSIYGDGQAIWARPLTFITDYWVMSGNGNPVNHPSKISADYGFVISVPSNCAVSGLHQIDIGNNVSHLNIEYFEMGHCGSDYDTSQVQIYNNSPTESSDITIRYNYLHDSGHMGLTRHWKDSVWEKNYFKDNWSTANNHGEAISSDYENNVTYRFNVFENACDGTGCVAPGHGPGDGHVSDGIKFYGNVVFYSRTPGADVGNGIVGCGVLFYCNNTEFYNNTIVDFGNKAASVLDGLGSGGQVYNNIWYNCSSIEIEGTHDHNASDINLGETNDQLITPLIFTNYASDDYRLSVGANTIDSGLSLAEPFNIDRAGITRPQGSGWDIGAYEYVEGQVVDIISPLAPSGLSVN